MPEPEIEPWMLAAGRLAADALEAGDMAAHNRIMDAAEARIDREVAEGRAARERGES
jgi:hypothetical protein